MLALADAYPPLSDRCLMFAADAFEKLGALADATAAYSRVVEGSSSFFEARLALARLHHEARNDAAGLAALEPLLGRAGRPRDPGAGAVATSGAASYKRQSACRGGEPPVCLVKSPATVQAARAAQHLSPAALTPELKLRRAERLLAEGEARGALALADHLGSRFAAGSADGCRARAVVAKAQRGWVYAPRPSKASETLASRCKDGEVRGQALWAVAEGQEPLDAIATLDRLAAERLQHALADDALLSAAVLLQRLEDPKVRCAGSIRWASSTRSPTRRRKRSWAFWLHRRARRLRQAFDALDRLDAVNRDPQSETHQQVRYWRARLFEETGETGKAAQLLESVVSTSPGTYYGHLAKDRLLELAPTRLSRTSVEARDALQSFGADVAVKQLYADPHFAAGIELLRLGLPEAYAELARVKLTAMHAQAKPLYLRVLLDAGRKKQVALLSSEGPMAGAPTRETEPVWRLAFPTRSAAWSSGAPRRATSTRISCRRSSGSKSGFNPNARSQVGAVGLAQVMPSTAEAVAKKAGLAYSEEELLQPGQNLKLGSLYLRSAIGDGDGSPLLVCSTCGSSRAHSF